MSLFDRTVTEDQLDEIVGRLKSAAKFAKAVYKGGRALGVGKVGSAVAAAGLAAARVVGGKRLRAHAGKAVGELIRDTTCPKGEKMTFGKCLPPRRARTPEDRATEKYDTVAAEAERRREAKGLSKAGKYAEKSAPSGRALKRGGEHAAAAMRKAGVAEAIDVFRSLDAE